MNPRSNKARMTRAFFVVCAELNSSFADAEAPVTPGSALPSCGGSRQWAPPQAEEAPRQHSEACVTPKHDG